MNEATQNRKYPATFSIPGAGDFQPVQSVCSE